MDHENPRWTSLLRCRKTREDRESDKMRLFEKCQLEEIRGGLCHVALKMPRLGRLPRRHMVIRM